MAVSVFTFFSHNFWTFLFKWMTTLSLSPFVLFHYSSFFTFLWLPYEHICATAQGLADSLAQFLRESIFF